MLVGAVAVVSAVVLRVIVSARSLLGRLALSFLFEFCRLLGGGTFGAAFGVAIDDRDHVYIGNFAGDSLTELTPDEIGRAHV